MISAMEIVILAIVGGAAGVLGGFFGVGGGILIVPSLVMLLHFSQKKAQGTSLVALLAPIGILGVVNYYKSGNADLRAGAIVAIGFFAGAWLGSKWALNLDDVLLRKSFAVFLACVSVYMFVRK